MLNKKSKEILARYEELHQVGASKYLPRIGYYYIQKVFTDSRYVHFYKAEALWKELGNESFNRNTVVTIQLNSIKETSPDPNVFDPESLINRALHVKDYKNGEIIFNSQPIPVILCNWHFDENEPKFYSDTPSIWEIDPKAKLIDLVDPNYDGDNQQDDDYSDYDPHDDEPVDDK